MPMALEEGQEVSADYGARFREAIASAVDFADWLKRLKRAYNLSYDYELADLLSIPAEIISGYFNGKRTPTALHLESIFKGLQIDSNSVYYARLLELAHKARLDMELSQKRNADKRRA